MRINRIQTTREEAYNIDFMGVAQDAKTWVVISGTKAKFYQQETSAIRHAEKTGGFPIRTHEAISEGLIEVI